MNGYLGSRKNMNKNGHKDYFRLLKESYRKNYKQKRDEIKWKKQHVNKY